MFKELTQKVKIAVVVTGLVVIGVLVYKRVMKNKEQEKPVDPNLN